MTRQEQAARAVDRTDPYRALVAAILRQAVIDARRRVRPTDCPTEDGCGQSDAIAFLRDPERIGFFAELVDCDGARIQPALLKAARLPLLTG